MEVTYSHCAGLDVHKKTVVACCLVPGEEGQLVKEVRTFSTMTCDLLKMGDWLTQKGVTHVALGSTGEYWEPVYNLLEDGFTLLVVNAQHIKNVLGRKTDVKDAEWIADLLRHGLVRSSFIPPLPQGDLRDLTRQRTKLVQERAAVVNRLQKVLEWANLKLASVVSDVTGVSARKILAAIASGTEDESKLAELAKGRLRSKRTQLEQALAGQVRPHHRFLIVTHLSHLDFLEEQIALFDAQIAQYISQSPAVEPEAPTASPSSATSNQPTPPPQENSAALNWEKAIPVLDTNPRVVRQTAELLPEKIDSYQSQFKSETSIIERFAAWGIENTVGFDFKSLLEELAQENLEEYTKTFFQESIEDWRGLGKQERLEIAFGQALREFLQLVQQELEDADCSEEERQQYAASLRKFLHDNTVLVELGKAFQEGVLDADKLEHTWQKLNMRLLPDEFDWKGIAKRYKKKADAILLESKELLAVLSDEAMAEVASDSDLIGYRKAIEQTYGYLKLDTLHTSGYSYRLQLLNIFVAQDVREVKEDLPSWLLELPKDRLKQLLTTKNPDELPQMVLQSLIRKSGLDKEAIRTIVKRYNQSNAEQTTRSASELIMNGPTYPCLVILGDPGSGKSSLVQYIALQWAASSIEKSSLLPLLIELRRYVQSRDKQKCQNFVEFCQQGHGFIYPLHPQQLNERLQTGKVFVLFDGLDEVFEASKREEVITEIIRFTQDYPQVRVLVTSRVIGYQPQRLRKVKFRHFMLQDLELEQIQEFLTHWHELAYSAGEEGKKKQERLQQAIKESPAIRQLAGNPLLLTMMAILNRNQELPRNRAELYSQASKVLLQQWDIERALVQRDAITIDFKDKQAMLRQVAYQMQGNDMGVAGNLINTEDLEGILRGYLEKNLDSRNAEANAELIVKQLRERNFILCFLGADYYAFVHRTFLEYFCAWYFVDEFEKKKSISQDKLKTEVFGKHCQDESWHEVLRLIAGMINVKFAGEIIDYLIEQNSEGKKFTNLSLAAACLSEIKNIKLIESTESRLINCLQGIAKDKLDTTVIRALAQAWRIELIVARATSKKTNYFDFEFSETEKERVADLVNLTYIGGLTQEKRRELDKYLLLDELIRVRSGWSTVDFISF